MQKKPSYMKPGVRSIEGSGVEGSFPDLKPGLGELTPPGLVSYPGGPSEVTYSQGATTPLANPVQGGQAVTMVPLTYVDGE